MTLRQLAEKIPAEYRREILLLNMISKAQPNAGDKLMNYLVTIWKNYIDSERPATCALCFVGILNDYKTIQAELIKLEKERQLLNSITTHGFKSDELLNDLNSDLEKAFKKL